MYKINKKGGRKHNNIVKAKVSIFLPLNKKKWGGDIFKFNFELKKNKSKLSNSKLKKNTIP